MNRTIQGGTRSTRAGLGVSPLWRAIDLHSSWWNRDADVTRKRIEVALPPA